MRSVYTGFFAKQIIGPESIDDYLLQAIAGELENTIGAVCGEAVLDPSGTGTGLGITTSADALNNRKITVTGDKNAVTDDGDLITCGSTSTERTYTSGAYSIKSHDDDWFENIPYENANATTYYVYVGQTKFPVDVGSARDGSRGYSVWADAAGFTVNPNSVTLSAGLVILKLDAVLTALGMPHWLTTNTEDPDWSMDCIVWLDTDQVGVTVQTDDPSIAIAVAKLTKDATTSAWRVDITAIGDGKLGQATASTTAAHYKVAILGPLITTTNTLQSDSAYVFIGTVLSGGAETVSTAGQAVTIPYASYASGFSVEHNGIPSSSDLGRHKQVTAQAGTDLDLRVDDAGNQVVRIMNIGGGTATLVVEDYAEIPTIAQTYDLNILLTSGTDRNVIMHNTGAGQVALSVGGYILSTNAFGGNGDFFAEGWYYSNSAVARFAVYDSVAMYSLGQVTQTGTAALVHSGGGGATVPYVYANAGIGGTVTFEIPIHPPDAFEITDIVIHYYQSAAGTPTLRVAIGRWSQGAIAIAQVITWRSATDTSGAFVSETFSGLSAIMSGNITDKYYLIVEITNNGIANDTCRLHSVAVGGLVYDMPGYQQ